MLGANDLGRLGQGDRVTRGDDPGELYAMRAVDLDGERVLRLTAGYSHNCVLLTGERVGAGG